MSETGASDPKLPQTTSSGGLPQYQELTLEANTVMENMYAEPQFKSGTDKNASVAADTVNTAIGGKTRKNSKLICIVFGLLISVTILLLICCCLVVVFLEIASLKSARESTNSVSTILQDDASSLNSKLEQMNASVMANLEKIMSYQSQQFLQITKNLSSIREEMDQLVEQNLQEVRDLYESVQVTNESLIMYFKEATKFQIQFLNDSIAEQLSEQSSVIQLINASIREEVRDLYESVQVTNESLIMYFKEATKFQIQLLNDSIAEQLSEQSSVIQLINASIREEFGNDKLQELNMSITDVNTFLVGQFPSNPASSCAELLVSSPASGYYWIVDTNGAAVRVYCDISSLCGGDFGRWRRVAELDMTNSGQECPSGLRERIDSNRRTCVKNSDSAGCSSVTISTTGVYSRVCGRIIGYQVGTTDGFARFQNAGATNIDSPYMEGVSLTHGTPRRHIWTFAAALDDISHHPANCPCSNVPTATGPPGFVGNDYFCDAGGAFLDTNPLWDGAGCRSQSTCCSFNTPPWFSKQLPQATADNIEMRVCRDGTVSDEDVAIELMDIYVQ